MSPTNSINCDLVNYSSFNISNLNVSDTHPSTSTTHAIKNNITFSSLNVCGLSSKLDFFDQSDTLESDFLIFTETKCDITSESTVSDFFKSHNYEIIYKHRKKFSTFKSGGIAMCIKKRLFNQCKIVQTKSPFVLWCIVDKSVLQ